MPSLSQDVLTGVVILALARRRGLLVVPIGGRFNRLDEREAGLSPTVPTCLSLIPCRTGNRRDPLKC